MSEVTDNTSPVLMSQGQYAQHRGCSQQAVSKAVRAGRISTVEGKIDAAVADQQWAANRNPRHAPTVASIDVAARADEPALPLLAMARAEGGDTTLAEASRRKEMAAAQIREIELGRLRGEMIPAAEVRQEFGELVSTARTRLLSIPPKIGARFGLAAQGLANAEIHAALEDLSAYR